MRFGPIAMPSAYVHYRLAARGSPNHELNLDHMSLMKLSNLQILGTGKLNEWSSACWSIQKNCSNKSKLHLVI